MNLKVMELDFPATSKSFINNFGTNKAGISKIIMGELQKKLWRFYELAFFTEV
jgi:hypothetical protein